MMLVLIRSEAHYVLEHLAKCTTQGGKHTTSRPQPLHVRSFVPRTIGEVIPISLQTLHLPRLEIAEVLLAEMDPADLVSDEICLDVLLGSRLRWDGSAFALYTCMLFLHIPRTSSVSSSPPSILRHPLVLTYRL